jgi:predicted enzyme related to lactoylglutathione lyase
MRKSVAIKRIVPNIFSLDLTQSKQFYTDFLGMELVMDMGWVMTFASKDNPTLQISIVQFDKEGSLDNTTAFLSIEVSDIDLLYERATNLNCEIVYPITNEPWGVRRFFVKDPNGATINLLAH